MGGGGIKILLNTDNRFSLQCDLDALPLCKGPCWSPPCHQQHCSWRFPLIETVLEQIGSFRRCFQGGCSSQLTQAENRMIILLSAYIMICGQVTS